MVSSPSRARRASQSQGRMGGHSLSYRRAWMNVSLRSVEVVKCQLYRIAQTDHNVQERDEMEESR